MLRSLRCAATTVTSTRTFEQFEAAYGGYDWEIGLRLPIRSDDFEARVFGGYYDFDREFGRDVQGWKVRTELRVLATLFLDAGLYENADLTGSDWFAGARLSGVRRRFAFWPLGDRAAIRSSQFRTENRCALFLELL